MGFILETINVLNRSTVMNKCLDMMMESLQILCLSREYSTFNKCNLLIKYQWCLN